MKKERMTLQRFAELSDSEMSDTYGGNMGVGYFAMRVAASFIGCHVLPVLMTGSDAAGRMYTKYPVAFVK